MNDQKQLIAIAEFCGFTRTLLTGCGWVFKNPNGSVLYCDPDPKGAWEIDRLPDYLKDLNVIHEAVEKLNKAQSNEWPVQLRAIVLRERKAEVRAGRLNDTHFYNATAAQRREALLRTIRKWEDGE